MHRWIHHTLNVVVATAMAAGTAHAGTVAVTSNLDAGAGTFREAIATASGDATVDQVIFDEGLDPIELLSAVTYSGAQDLSIVGHGAHVGPEAGYTGNLFVSDAGASLDVADLVFAGAGEQAIFVPVPGSATGTVTLALTGVVIRDSGLHGAHFSDAAASAASLRLELESVTILSNGLGGVSDFDGIRVDELGDGDLVANIKGTVSLFNGGDGIELDESGAGSAKANVQDSSFDMNGPQDPTDLEDGFDIDEADDGDLNCTLKNVSASGNFDGGIDLDEAGDGKLNAKAVGLSANGNGADGIKTTEENAGDSKITLSNSRIVGTTDNDGTEFEQETPGEMTVTITKTLIASNVDHGVNIDSDGPGVLELKKTTILDNDEPQVDLPGGWVIE